MDFCDAQVYLSNLFLTFLAPNLGKILIIGGSIANFTNVAATFKVTSCRGMWVGWEQGREVSVQVGLRQKQVPMSYPVRGRGF